MDRRICDDLEEELSAYSDGELVRPARDRLVQHLALCDQCPKVLDRYRAFGAALRDQAEVLSRRELWMIAWPIDHAPVRSTDRALTPRRGLIYHVTRWFDPWPVLAGATALIALLIGLQMFRSAPFPSNAVEIDQLDA